MLIEIVNRVINPVNYGFCQKPEEWLYSSYNSCISEKSTRLKRDEILEWFGNRDSFIDFHNNNIIGLDSKLELD